MYMCKLVFLEVFFYFSAHSQRKIILKNFPPYSSSEHYKMNDVNQKMCYKLNVID